MNHQALDSIQMVVGQDNLSSEGNITPNCVFQSNLGGYCVICSSLKKGMTANRRTRHCFIVIKAQEEFFQTAEKKGNMSLFKAAKFLFCTYFSHSVNKYLLHMRLC